MSYRARRGESKNLAMDSHRRAYLPTHVFWGIRWKLERFTRLQLKQIQSDEPPLPNRANRTEGSRIVITYVARVGEDVEYDWWVRVLKMKMAWAGKVVTSKHNTKNR